MKTITAGLFTLLFAIAAYTQNLPYQCEDLTAPEFIKAVEKSPKTCIIPIDVFEKHGAHLPLEKL
ncbi:MAG: hypothetical protein ACOC0C_01180 [Bacteroidota bacterium]